MTTLKMRLFRGITLTLLTIALASLAHAQSQTMRRRVPGQTRPAPFEVSGVFSGVTGGEVLIDGVGYRLCDSPVTYQLGVGLVPIGAVAIGSRVYAAGTSSLGSGTICSLIARPADEGTAKGGDPSAHVRVRESSPPQ